MIKPWKKISSKFIGDFRIFKLRSDVCLSPRTGKEHDFYVLDSVNWVNVLAVTPDQQLVMVEQYRHGSNTVELEIPGGMMDPGETDPVATAVRELREETGYEGENARLLGRIWSNPAILSNKTYTVLIENCRLKHDVKFDRRRGSGDAARAGGGNSETRGRRKNRPFPRRRRAVPLRFVATGIKKGGLNRCPFFSNANVARPAVAGRGRCV